MQSTTGFSCAFGLPNIAARKEECEEEEEEAEELCCVVRCSRLLRRHCQCPAIFAGSAVLAVVSALVCCFLAVGLLW